MPDWFQLQESSSNTEVGRGTKLTNNSINNGFLALECAGIVGAFQDGDEADLDLTGGTITNRRTGQTLTFVPVPQFALDVQRAGGWLEYMKAREEAAKEEHHA